MTMSEYGGVAFRGMRRLKVVKIRRFLDGKESDSFNFSPSTHGAVEEFFKISDIVWRECGLHELNGAARRYVESLREHGERVEVSIVQIPDCSATYV